MFKVSRSTSTKNGRAPRCSTTCAVAQKVNVVVSTTSPGPTPKAANATCNASVQELTPRAPCAPTNSANLLSNCLTFGPVVIQFERRVSTTSEISCSPIAGGEKGRNWPLNEAPPLNQACLIESPAHHLWPELQNQHNLSHLKQP